MCEHFFQRWMTLYSFGRSWSLHTNRVFTAFSCYTDTLQYCVRVFIEFKIHIIDQWFFSVSFSETHWRHYNTFSNNTSTTLLKFIFFFFRYVNSKNFLSHKNVSDIFFLHNNIMLYFFDHLYTQSGLRCRLL